MKSIDAYLAPHADALRLRNQRMKILASNIANSDTPNYKARDLAFASALQRASGSPRGTSQGPQQLKTSHARHLPGSESVGATRIMYRVPHSPSLDGNTVDKDLEQSRFAENTLRYEASMQFLSSRVNSLLRSIKGE